MSIFHIVANFIDTGLALVGAVFLFALDANRATPEAADTKTKVVATSNPMFAHEKDIEEADGDDNSVANILNEIGGQQSDAMSLSVDGSLRIGSGTKVRASTPSVASTSDGKRGGVKKLVPIGSKKTSKMALSTDGSLRIGAKTAGASGDDTISSDSGGSGVSKTTGGAGKLRPIGSKKDSAMVLSTDGSLRIGGKSDHAKPQDSSDIQSNALRRNSSVFTATSTDSTNG